MRARRLLTPLLVAVVAAAGCSAARPSSPEPTATPHASSPASPPVRASPSATATVGALPSPSGDPGTSPSTAPAGPPVWAGLEARGPAAREDHTWTADTSARIAYLFGGRDGATVHGDLWAYDLATDAWREVRAENDGPTPRFGHEAVWVDGRGVIVWAGQAGPTTFFDDLWAFDPATRRWTELPNGGARPVARYGSCAALGPDARLWISHGFTEDGTRFADTRAYDFAAGTWTDETPGGRAPVNRCLHGCWWTDAGELALYAGQTTGVQALGDLWRLAATGQGAPQWRRVDGSLPDERNLYAFARHGDAIVVFGGRGLGTEYHRDLFAIDAATLAVRPIAAEGARPPARSGATLIDDPEAGRLLLFGGRNASRAFADTWQLALP